MIAEQPKSDSQSTSMNILETLRTVWGFDSLRPVQQEVVEASLVGRDAVVVMPTGGGKSLCYQLPALVTQSLTVVVSPLIALMKDQVDALRLVGVEAAALNSSLPDFEIAEIEEALRAGQIRLLYISPERLVTQGMIALLKQSRVARFAIDEAHCISAWGHDFRPEYRQMSLIREHFPETPIMAFTATATPRVQRDIAIQLRLTKPKLFVGTFDRPNLTYRIQSKDDKLAKMIQAIRRHPGEGTIVYALSRADTESIAEDLCAEGVQAQAYHAGLDAAVRSRISEEFAQEKLHVVVATIAFGMGIDRANVRCVMHDCIPKSMEAYQQETGRAGRDGLPAECVLFFSLGDVERVRRLMALDPKSDPGHQGALLEEVRNFAMARSCRHKALSEHFGQSYEVPEGGCGACDVCLEGLIPLANADEVGAKIRDAVLELQGLLGASRSGEARGFGLSYVARVLRGENKKEIRERGAHEIPHYGIFKGQSTERVTSWIRQLVDQGVLAQSMPPYPVVTVTESGREASQFEIYEHGAIETKSSRRSKSVPAIQEAYDEGLFEMFREWRKRVADDRGVPPYVVFHDATLMRVAAVMPSSLARLGSVPGFGEKRLADFGDDLLRIIEEYVAGKEVTRDQPLHGAPPVERPKPKSTSNQKQTQELFARSESVEAVAEALGIQLRSAWNNLERFVETYPSSDLSPWIAPELESRIRAAAQEVGLGYRKPIFEALGGEVDYGPISVVRAKMIAESEGNGATEIREGGDPEHAM
ncbi:MAG: RecQ family ATP-dependent DNA helicase [Armatimonadetes bacterium]|nr:RecQ family ATP-dependent DNA helicase [Armatimonadota bacterium]